MASSRLPRFSRSSNVAPFRLTERDCDIIRTVNRHRFLRSSHIVALLGGSPQQVVRRLQLLYHHGFLERPRCQLDYYHQGGTREMVYGLGNKGGAFLREECGFPLRDLHWGEKNRSVGRVYLEHALLVSSVMVALELACRKTGRVRLIQGEELQRPDTRRSGRPSFRWKVDVDGFPLGVVPDRAFALDRGDDAGTQTRAFFFLEADRGTMPVIRDSLSQTSFYRKLLAYQATWSQSIHRERFGFHRFRVLTITKSAERVQSLVSACARLTRGHGLFLFADRTILEKPEDILSAILQTGRSGQTATLLD
jgi:hypothetical protein